MLIVCPSCATSYKIDPASVGANGRTVRCTRCQTAWFAPAPPPAPEVAAFVEDVIAEAEAQTAGAAPAENLPPGPAEIAATLASPKDEVAEFAAALGDAPAEPVPQAEPVAQDEPAPAGEGSVATIPVEEPPIAIAEAPSLVPPGEPAPLCR